LSAADRAGDAQQAMLAALPTLPRNGDDPVFREPWEAQAFAMTLSLHEQGLFTWVEWAAALAAEIKRAQAAGDPDTGDTYYHHWLAALEQIAIEKGLADPVRLEQQRLAWDRAARATPHGEPILLENDPQG
jgi:nitrile hydratase accessory protein